MIFQLVQDFNDFLEAVPNDHPRVGVLQLLLRAIRRDVNFIARNTSRYPQALFQSLWNSCWWHGGELTSLMEDWLRHKEAIDPDVVWVRSILPPAVALDSAQVAVIQTGGGNAKQLFFSEDDLHLHAMLELPDDGVGVIKTWDASSGQELPAGDPITKLHSICPFNGGKCSVLRSSNGLFAVLAMDNHSWLMGWQPFVFSNSSTAMGGSFASSRFALLEKEAVRIWDAVEKRELQAIAYPYPKFGKYLTDVALSPSGNHVLLAAGDTLLKELPDGELRKYQYDGHDSSPTSWCWAGNSAIATGAIDATIRIWDLAAGRQILLMAGHEGPITELIGSSSARLLASAGKDETVRVWDVSVGRLLHTFRDLGGPAKSLAFSSDEQSLTAVTLEGKICRWDLTSEQLIGTIQLCNAQVADVLLSPEGSRVAVSKQGSVEIFEVAKGSRLVTSAVPEYKVNDLRSEQLNPTQRMSFSASGEQLAVLSNQGAHVYDARTGEQLQHWAQQLVGPAGLCLSPDADRVFLGARLQRNLGDIDYHLWLGKKNAPLVTIAHGVRAAWPMFSPDGSKVAVNSFGVITIFDRDGALVTKFVVSKGGSLVAYSPRGDCFASAGNFGFGITSVSVIHVWRPEQELAWRSFSAVSKYISCIAFSECGNYLAAGGGDGNVYLWELEKGILQSVFSGHEGNVNSVAFSHDSKLLASCSIDRTIRVWSTAPVEKAATSFEQIPELSGVQSDPTGRFLATGDWQGNVVLRDWATGASRGAKGEGDTFVESYSLKFSRDGSMLTIDNRKRSVHANYRDQWHRLVEQEDKSFLPTHFNHSPCEAMAYSEALQRVVALQGGRLKCWDSRSGELIDGMKFEWSPASIVNTSPTLDLVPQLGFVRDKPWMTVAVTTTVWLLDAQTGQMIIRLSGKDASDRIELGDIADSGKFIAAILYRVEGNTRLPATGQVWDVRTGAPQVAIPFARGLSKMRFSPNGNVLAVLGSDHVQMWEVLQKREKGRVSVGLWYGGDMCFSPDGMQLALGCLDNSPDHRTVTVLNVPDGKIIAELSGKGNHVNKIAYSKDGTRLVASCNCTRVVATHVDNDDGIQAWETSTWRRVAVMRGGANDAGLTTLANGELPRFAADVVGRELVVTSAEGETAVARIGLALKELATHPGGRRWAGTISNRLFMVELQGNPHKEPPRSANGSLEVRQKPWWKFW